MPDEERQRWLLTWKRWAAGQLPSDAPRRVKVHVRATVERTLSPFGPQDDADEVRDMVLGVVEAALEASRMERERIAREVAKRTLIAGAPSLLRVALRRFPKDEVAAMLKRPRYSLSALTHGLRRHLERHVTGDETADEILDRVISWVEQRLAEQPRLPRIVGKAGAATALFGAIALQNPEVREAAAKAFDRARDKVHELWTRWTGSSSHPHQP